jgi:DNA helicase-2/ATP-dependent DNA helicase PcrA
VVDDEATDEGGAALYERLRSWRTDVATSTRTSAHAVLVDATLAEIARRRPSSLGELAQIRGVGQTALDRYGAVLLGLVASAARSA